MDRSLHLGVAAATGLLAAVWFLAMSLAISGAGLPSSSAGIGAAVFPPMTTDLEVHRAVARAEGAVVRRTWLPFVWIVDGQSDGFVGRLGQEGALLVMSRFPFEPVLGGCLGIHGLPMQFEPPGSLRLTGDSAAALIRSRSRPG